VSLQKKITKRSARRAFRVRNKFMSRQCKPRVSVFRSARHIYAQIIDDVSHATLASYSTLLINDKASKTDVAKKVGIELGRIAQEKSISDVFFDRGDNKYHGRVAALADGLRESGLKF
jgi:large subunit ribosomal protein L18